MCCGEGLGEFVFVVIAVLWTISGLENAFNYGEFGALIGPAVLWLVILVWAALVGRRG